MKKKNYGAMGKFKQEAFEVVSKNSTFIDRVDKIPQSAIGLEET